MNSQKKLKIGLKSIFGYEKYLNELQQKAVENIWEAKRDVFVRGFGKSICYQLPVMIKDNTFIIVVSSRTSYIKRQQNYLKSKQIKTNYLSSNTSRKKKNAIEKDIISETSELKILFLTPYQYESGYFKTLIKKINKERLFYIVLDQADNIVSKQENLRKQYQNLDLKIIRVPIIAISAAATFAMQKDIITKFGLTNPKIYAMPILRTNLYYDIWYINTLPDPIAHLTKFIENCFCLSAHANSVEKGSWGLIFCEDLEATISIAKFFTSIGIPALPHCICSNKNKNLKNAEDVKVITVSEEINILTVTNSLVKIIDKKLVRFIVYWYVLPNIEKYYLQSSQTQSFDGVSYCRIYCQVDDLMNCYAHSSFLNDDNNDELFIDIKNSLIQVQCRHKVYTEYCGDAFSACKNYCDVCKKKEEVEEKINLLLEIINNGSLKKLQETLPELSKNSIKVCNKNLQQDYLKQTICNEYQIKSNMHNAIMKSNDDSLSLDTNIQHNEENGVELNKNKKKIICSESQTKSNVDDAIMKSNDNPSLDKSIQYDEENGAELNKKLQAISNLDKIYKKLYSTQQSTPTFTLHPTQSSNVKKVNSLKKLHSKKSEKTKRVIAINNEHYLRENSIRRNDVSSVSNVNKQFNNEIDSAVIFMDEISSNNLLRCNDILDRSSKRNRETKKRTVEIITIEDDEVNEKEECFAQNETEQVTKNNVYNSDKNEDDIILVEVKLLNKKRCRSTEKDSHSSPTSFERWKRRKNL